MAKGGSSCQKFSAEMLTYPNHRIQDLDLLKNNILKSTSLPSLSKAPMVAHKSTINLMNTALFQTYDSYRFLLVGSTPLLEYCSGIKTKSKGNRKDPNRKGDRPQYESGSLIATTNLQVPLGGINTTVRIVLA